jgi:two-component system chemotaxis response regulator CheB
MRHIHDAGGLTAVQDPEEAEVDTMPRAALALHHPDRVLPLRALRTFLMDLNALHAD